jgi:hypothetical protein
LAKEAQIPTPSGTVNISAQSIAVGIGINWGTGTLTYKGKDYLFTVKGLSDYPIDICKSFRYTLSIQQRSNRWPTSFNNSFKSFLLMKPA